MQHRSALWLVVLLALTGLAGCGGGGGTKAESGNQDGPSAEDSDGESDDAQKAKAKAVAADIEKLSDGLRDDVLAADLGLTREAGEDLPKIQSFLRQWRQALVDFDKGVRDLDVPGDLTTQINAALEAVASEIEELDEELVATDVAGLEALRPKARTVIFERNVAVNALRAQVGLDPVGPARKGPAKSVPGSPVFEDDFEDPASGWSTADTENGAIGYADGAYEIIVKVPGHGQNSDTQFEGDRFRQELVELGDVSIEVDIRKKSPIVAVLGVACRQAVGGGDQYQAVFDVDGFWLIAKATKEFTVLAESTRETDASEFAATGDGVNRLRMDCVGPAGGETTLTLYLNGQKVGEAKDPAGLRPGAVALHASALPDAEGGVVVQYDNLEIRTMTAAAS